MIEFDSAATIYDAGRAVCQSDIKTQTMVCRFREEVWEFPIGRTYGVVRYNGYFYEADIDDIRKLAEDGTA